MTDYDSIPEDQLVLYIEEKTNDEIDMRCFIIFDKYEQEYYIAGQRNHVNATQFKLYCKSKTKLFNFIKICKKSFCKFLFVFNDNFKKVLSSIFLAAFLFPFLVKTPKNL
jgi:hypothetical protein